MKGLDGGDDEAATSAALAAAVPRPRVRSSPEMYRLAGLPFMIVVAFLCDVGSAVVDIASSHLLLL